MAFTTLFGKIYIHSIYLWKRGNSCNTTDALGIRHEGRSDAVNAALVDFGSEHSFDEAATMFQRHYDFKISDSTIRRITESYGITAEQFIKTKLEKYEADADEGTPSLPTIILGFDGCSIRTGELQIINQDDDQLKTIPLRTPSGRHKCKRNEEWRDVRLGFSKSNSEGSKKFFIGGMTDLPTLITSLFNLSLGLGMNENTKPVAIADGGNGLYEELDRQFCDLQFILDYYHFREHLYDTAKERGLDGDVKDQWIDQKTSLAWNGQAMELIKILENEYEMTGNDKTRKLIGYVTRFKECISYKSFVEQGFSIGSGEIESAHKYVTQKRLKLTGACWKPKHVNPMLALRLVKNNGWWNEFLNYCTDEAKAA